jgi:hypothetical protein
VSVSDGSEKRDLYNSEDFLRNCQALLPDHNFAAFVAALDRRADDLALMSLADNDTNRSRSFAGRALEIVDLVRCARNCSERLQNRSAARSRGQVAREGDGA